MSDNKYRGPFSGRIGAIVAVAIVAVGVTGANFLNQRPRDPGLELQIGLAEGYRDFRLKAFASDELPEFRPATSEEWLVFCQNWAEAVGCDLLAEVGYPFSRTKVQEQCKFEQKIIDDGPAPPIGLNAGFRRTWRAYDPKLEPAIVCAAYGFDLSS
ncbi:MAG: hypothetical protein AAF251_02555 [Pseudomonadota bacterium]